MATSIGSLAEAVHQRGGRDPRAAATGRHDTSENPSLLAWIGNHTGDLIAAQQRYDANRVAPGTISS